MLSVFSVGTSQIKTNLFCAKLSLTYRRPPPPPPSNRFFPDTISSPSYKSQFMRKLRNFRGMGRKTGGGGGGDVQNYRNVQVSVIFFLKKSYIPSKTRKKSDLSCFWFVSLWVYDHGVELTDQISPS